LPNDCTGDNAAAIVGGRRLAIAKLGKLRAISERAIDRRRFDPPKY
jgi:hypothetical protein